MDVAVGVGEELGVEAEVEVGVGASLQIKEFVFVVHEFVLSMSCAITPKMPPLPISNGCVTGRVNERVPLPLRPPIETATSFDSTVAMNTAGSLPP